MDPQLNKDKIKSLILEEVANEKPESTQRLTQLMQQKNYADPELITQALLELEDEGKLHFTKPETTPASSVDYVFSQKALWYWTIIALSIATTISVFTIPEAIYPVAYMRNVLGIIFILVLPGYSFIKALFPTTVPFKTSSENLDNIERLALSIGMSLALVPIVGLILNYTPWGIRLTPVTLSLLALTVICATAAVLREHQTKTITTQTNEIQTKRW